MKQVKKLRHRKVKVNLSKLRSQGVSELIVMPFKAYLVGLKTRLLVSWETRGRTRHHRSELKERQV